MKVDELFVLSQGNGFELMNMELSETAGINFVSRTAQNNGVVAQVAADSNIKPFPSGFITVALGGSVLSAFVQARPFYTAFHVMVLKPRKEMTLQEKLYYCMCIQANAYRYNYGRQANKTLRDIELPDTGSIPEWVNDTLIEPVKTAVICQQKHLSLNVADWKEFRIGDLFMLERCKNSSSGELFDGNDCYYLGAKKSDNGVMRRVARNDLVVSKGNCIVFIGNGQGSVGYANYMDEDFIGTADLTVGYNERLNKYIGMFIVTLLDLERPKYSFGRKWSSRIASTTIKLPATAQGLPDWEYMEQYIRSLSHSDKI